MFLTEPPPSQGDLRFRVFGFPVRVHPMFWVVTVLMALKPGKDGGTTPKEMLIWVGVVFVSILVHELGHAFMQRRFGGRPWITLYSLGGLASCDDEDRTSRSQIIISLAGPAAGFLLAAAIIGFMRLTGHETSVQWGETPSIEFRGIGFFNLYRLWVIAEPFDSMTANLIVLQALWVNIGWGLINLLPIYPLDGGRVSREVFTIKHPRIGIVYSLQLSLVAAIAMAAFAAMKWQSLFVTVMFGYLAYSNYQTLQAYRSNRW